eukprot:Tbor_TRINITY_DN1930_c0_g1::TRINITY_DN1930_c0_g1_i1::g.3527::m.3527
MSKTLDDWLNTSSESEQSINTKTNAKKDNNIEISARNESRDNYQSNITSRAVSPDTNAAKEKREREAAERRQKLKDMKNKIKDTLGEDIKIEQEPQIAATIDDAYSDFGSEASTGYITAPNEPLVLSHKPHYPSGSSLRPAHERSHDRTHGFIPHGHEEIEVMVVDRGCQTACDAEVQTGPELMTSPCAMCCSGIYPISNAFGCIYHNSLQQAVTAAPSRDPIVSNLMDKCSHLVRCSLEGPTAHIPSYGPGMGLAASFPFIGHYNHHPPLGMWGTAPAPQHLSAGWKESLAMINGSIDDLIRRYNLKPPPPN